MFKKIFIFILSAIILIESVMPVYAGESITDLQEKQKEIENKIEEYKKQAENLKNEKNNIQAEILMLDNELNTINLEIDKKQLQKKELEMQIAEVESNIDDLTEKISENNDALEARLRTMYMNGTAGYIEVILNAENLVDALTRVDMIQMIVESDVELLKDIENQKKEVEDLHLTLQTKKFELTALINNLEIEQNKILVASRSKENYMVKLQNNIEEIARQEAEMKAQSEQIAKDILALQRKNTTYVGGEMAWPVPSSERITSFFGPREEPIKGAGTNHGAIDVGAWYGEAIVSANYGEVIFTGSHYSYGNYLIVDHGGGIATLYAHCSKILVSKGQEVARGETIALIGSTGYSTGPHLHFEVRENGLRVNPLPYLK